MTPTSQGLQASKAVAQTQLTLLGSNVNWSTGASVDSPYDRVIDVTNCADQTGDPIYLIPMAAGSNPTASGVASTLFKYTVQPGETVREIFVKADQDLAVVRGGASSANVYADAKRY